MTTDHVEPCEYAWCHAHRMCTCAYSDQFPHRARGCGYNRDADEKVGDVPHVSAGDLRNPPITAAGSEGQEGDR